MTHCNTLQHTLQHTATHCNTLQHTAMHLLSLSGENPLIGQRKQPILHIAVSLDEPSTDWWHVSVAVCCSVLQYAAVCCSMSQSVAV